MVSCKDCLHVGACEFISQRQEKLMNDFFNEQGRETSVKFGLPDAEKCPHFKDRSRFVELPCSTSEDLFVVKNSGEIMQDKVETIVSIGYDEDFSLSKIDCYSGKTYNVSDIGKTIFFTFEEAERALKEREGQ